MTKLYRVTKARVVVCHATIAHLFEITVSALAIRPVPRRHSIDQLGFPERGFRGESIPNARVGAARASSGVIEVRYPGQNPSAGWKFATRLAEERLE
jgi:hypothetical protein